MQTQPRLACSFPLLLLTLSGAAAAQSLAVEEGRLGLPTPSGGAQWGSAVSISNQRVAVGATSSNAPGRAVTFKRAAGLWTLDATVDSLDGTVNDQFGSALALDGNVLLVGAPGGNATPSATGTGVAYVFQRSGPSWSQAARFVSATPKSQGLFGAAVALDGNTLAIGAPQHGPLSTGAVDVYVRSAGVWSFQQQLATPGLTSGARFGTAVALAGNRIAVGAPYQLVGGGTQAGQVYVFERAGNTWASTQELGSPSGVPAGTFGSSLALDGTRLAVGAPGEPQSAAFWGRVHTFVLTGPSWTFEQTLGGSNTSTQNCRFGHSVALEGARLLVGATGYSGFAGGVKLFERPASTWVERTDLLGSSSSFNGQLGHSVSLESDLATAGAPFATSPFQSGEAYVWNLDGGAPSVYCTAKPASVGCLASIGWNGTASATSLSPFLVTATQVVGKKSGILIYGPLYNAAPFQGGTLCVGTPIKRTPGQHSGGLTNTDCTGTFSIDFNAYVRSGANPALGPGSWVWAQYYFRDSLSASKTGLSNALRFHVGP